MGIQPTASKTDLLLQCSRPFAADTEVERDEPGEAAIYGTQFHEAMAASVASVFGATVSPETTVSPEIRAHARRTWRVFTQWLDQNGYKTRSLVRLERPLAITLGRTLSLCETMPTRFDVETHTYHLAPSQMGGTSDIVLSNWDQRLVADYKTGEGKDFSNPKTGQMLTLAIAEDAAEIAIVHSPRAGIPVVYAAPVTTDEKEAHRKKLRIALQKIGDGSLRPGPECKYCPARLGCPAHYEELARKTWALVKTLAPLPVSQIEVDLGRFHQLWPGLERLAKVVREDIRERVKAGEVIERPDGKTLAVNTVTREVLSKTSILEAMGKKRGEKMLESLRQAGAITTTTYEELRAK